MPNERITSTNSGLDLEVSWGRDCGYVQVAATCSDLKRSVEYFKGVMTYADEHPDVELYATGWYPDLDRAAINRLIRTLRHARDQACGRDE